MALRINNGYNFNYRDYIRPYDESSHTVPDLNVNIETLLRDFTRDARSFDFVDDRDDDESTFVDIPSETMPSLDPLTDQENVSDELSDIQSKLNSMKDT